MKQNKSIIIDSNSIELPTGWDKLTADQITYIAKQKFQCPDRSTYMTNSLLHLLGFKPKKGINVSDASLQFNFVKDNQMFKIDAITILSMFEKIEWLNEPAGAMECPQFKNVKAPNSKLYGVSLEKFMHIDRIYCDFVNTTDPKLLDPLFASLYKGKNGFKKVTELDKFVVVFWFTGLKTWMKYKYPYVFSSSDSEYFDDETFEETPIEEYIMSIVASLNEGRAADNDNIKQGEVHEMFFELNRKIEFAKSQKK